MIAMFMILMKFLFVFTLTDVFQNACNELLQQHSNIVTIKPIFKNNHWCIGVGVICKGFIPLNEHSMTKSIDNYPIIVFQSTLCLCTTDLLLINPLDTMNPIHPGCSISPESFSDFTTKATF